MNLDDRARQARASLQHHVGTDLDLGEARASLESRQRRQRSDRRRARIGAAALTVVALLGGVALVSSGGGGSAENRGPSDLAIDDLDRDPDSDAAMIEAMPLGPTDGKESWRLPVAAAPQSGLHEGDTITIYGRGFEPYDSLGVVHCGSEADTENAGVNGCDLDGGSNGTFAGVQYVSADHKGDVVADIVVRRFIQTPGYGRIDCASAPERCLIGMGAISDYDRSGGVYIDFAGAPEFPVPTFTVSPDPAQLVPGQEVQVDVTQWVPGRQIRIQQCIADDGGFDGSERCEPLLDTRADADGAFNGLVVVNAEVVTDSGAEACADDCFLQATGIGIREGTTAPFPDPVAIDFVGGGSETTTTHPGTTTAPPPVEGNPANPDASSDGPVTTIVVGGSEPVDGAGPAAGAEPGAATGGGTGG